MVEQRFGIGEWYGRDFTTLSSEERRHYAAIQFLPRNERPAVACPFMSTHTAEVACSKAGGVCSLRKYARAAQGDEVAVSQEDRSLRTVCPNRFEQGGEIYRWIGEVILGESNARPIGKVNFLRRTGDASGRENVGQIDNILVVPGTDPLRWCAVEIQAVYFSGRSMRLEFEEILSTRGALVFPTAVRRPDYRSSGPKRLMPQLQIKVPTLSRWGKKMAVVVDAEFFRAMGQMNTVPEITNCDVAWFVAGYDDQLNLVPSAVHFTTLDESVRGLIAGLAVSLPQFEERIRAKLLRSSSGPRQVPADE